MYHIGYLGYYWVSKQQINQKWLERVEYSGHMKEVSIPIDLPYWNDQDEYHYTTGKFTWEGKVYRKVKQKYSKGALHVLLVEDNLTQELNESVSDWIKSVTDTQSESSGNTVVKSFVKDYIHLPFKFTYQPGFSLLAKEYFSYSGNWLSISLEVATPPPQNT